MNNLLLILLIVIYCSIPGYLLKAGYSFLKGILPIYNVFTLFKVLEINIGFLFIIAGFIIIPYSREFTLTLLYIFLPFMICHAYGKPVILGLFGIAFPFVFYPLMAYILGVYMYDTGVELWDLLKKKNSRLFY